MGAQEISEHRDDGALDDLEAVGSAHRWSKARGPAGRERECAAGARASGGIQLADEHADFPHEAADAGEARRGAGRQDGARGRSGTRFAFGHVGRGAAADGWRRGVN
jgi:hypothetical protein